MDACTFCRFRQFRVNLELYEWGLIPLGQQNSNSSIDPEVKSAAFVKRVNYTLCRILRSQILVKRAAFVKGVNYTLCHILSSQIHVLVFFNYVSHFMFLENVHLGLRYVINLPAIKHSFYPCYWTCVKYILIVV